MSSRIKRATENLIINLSCADTAQVREYITEIHLNREFQNGVEVRRNTVGRKQYAPWDISISITLGVVLYALCRKQKPGAVVETGVFSVISSSYILCAMEENKRGQLYSIDLPQWHEGKSGWMIPDYLRHRWHLMQGKSSEKLVPLLEEIANIDIFFHDSEHSYKNMLWEFKTAWTYLKAGGLFLSHNIDENDAFYDFCRERGIRSYLLSSMGGMVKPIKTLGIPG